MILNKKLEISGHSGPVYSLTYSNSKLYSTSSDKWVARWSLENGIQDSFSIQVDAVAYAIYHCQNLPILVIGCSNGNIHIIDTDSKKEIKFLKHHSTAIFSILEMTDKNFLLTGDASGNLCIWNLLSFKLEIQLPLNCGKIRQIVLSNDLSQIYIASKDGKFRILETKYFNQIAEININETGIQSILEIEHLLILADYDGYLYQINKEDLSINKKIPAHKGSIYSIVQIENNLFLSASRDKSIKVWNALNFSVIEKKEFKTGGHKNSVNRLLNLNSYTIASCSDDGRIILWDIKV
jgi:WD40 repeat protein